MFALEPLQKARYRLNDVNPNGRWSDATLLAFEDDVCKELMRDVQFPFARIATYTLPDQQEYQLPDSAIRIDTVYVNGQIAVPTDRMTLQGQQIQQYDQGYYGSQGTQTSGSGGPTGTTGTFTPKWNVQPPMEYPVNNSWRTPAPDAQPWSANQRPRYYDRGGYIGLVPQPSNTPVVLTDGSIVNNLVIDLVMLHEPVINLTQKLWFPELFSETITWGIVMAAKYADDTDSTKESRNFAQSKYNEGVTKLRMWAATWTGDAAGGPKVQTNRGSYRGRMVRSPRGSGYP